MRLLYWWRRSVRHVRRAGRLGAHAAVSTARAIVTATATAAAAATATATAAAAVTPVPKKHVARLHIEVNEPHAVQPLDAASNVSEETPSGRGRETSDALLRTGICWVRGRGRTRERAKRTSSGWGVSIQRVGIVAYVFQYLP